MKNNEKIELLESLTIAIDEGNCELARLKPILDRLHNAYVSALSEYSTVKRAYDDLFRKVQTSDIMKCQLKRSIEALPIQMQMERRKTGKKKGKQSDKDKLIKMLLIELQKRNS